MTPVTPRPAPTVRSTLVRILRTACPACGRGRLFRSHFVRAERCTHCGWKFERERGFWVGGSEVHMFASYGASVLLLFPVLFLAGTSAATVALVIAGHVVLSLGIFRWSRAVFVGLDYLLDPARPAPPDDDRRESRAPRRPRPPGRGASRRRKARTPLRTWPRRA
jgi:uncharacterized protein (DUF983 family)